MESGKQKCLLDTTLHAKCLANCKSAVAYNNWQTRLQASCIAREKLELFVEGRNSLAVAQTAFEQADPSILEAFSKSSEDNLDLIRYFLGAVRASTAAQVAEFLGNETLLKIFSKEHEAFVAKRKKRETKVLNYFELKSAWYWGLVPVQRICDLIRYVLKDRGLVQVAGQFMFLIPPAVIAKFPEISGLTSDEERTLFLGLEGDLFNLPLISPGIYSHLMTLFAENPEIGLVLGGMEELVKRRATVVSITSSFLDYYNKHNSKITVPALYSELFGIEVELALEILTQLQENEVISANEKTTVLDILKSGKFDYLKHSKEDILGK